MHSFFEKIVLLLLIGFSQPTFSSPLSRRQASAAGCDGNARTLALGLQNILSIQSQEISLTKQMMTTISSDSIDQNVFGVQQSQLLTKIQNTISIMKTSQSIQFDSNGVSTTLSKMTQVQSTQLTELRQIGNSFNNRDGLMQSLNQLSTSFQSCERQSQQILQQTLTACPDIGDLNNDNQSPNGAINATPSNTSSDDSSNKKNDDQPQRDAKNGTPSNASTDDNSNKKNDDQPQKDAKNGTPSNASTDENSNKKNDDQPQKGAASSTSINTSSDDGSSKNNDNKKVEGTTS